MGAAERIEQALQEAMAAAGVPGLTAAARLPDGEVIEVAVGARGVDNAAAMSPDTVFWIASCTKAITTAAAMQLVEQGRVGLDDPVGAVLPGLANPMRLSGFDAAGAPVLVPASRPITLRHLLTHTSGLAYDFTSPDITRYRAAMGQTPSSAGVPDMPLVFEPGEGWIYGISTDWTGALVEAVSGETLDIYLRDHVFEPLGMGETSFAPGEAQADRRASMHARLPDGGLAPISFGMPPPPHFGMGGGGLYSTAPDYLKFLRAILEDGGAILSPASVAAMRGVQTSGDHVGVLRSAAANMSNDFDPFPGMAKDWTPGFVSNPAPGPNGRAAGSLAWAGLGNCYYWIDPKSGVAGAMFAQLLPFADPKVLEAFGAFERAVYAA